MCEEFGCLPSAAIREIRRHPDLVFDVIDARAYANTRDQLHRAKEEKDAPKGVMADLVTDIEIELFKERQARLSGEVRPDVE